MRSPNPLAWSSAMFVLILAAHGSAAISPRPQSDPRRNQVVGITLNAGGRVPILERQRTDFAACATTGCPVPGLKAPTRPWSGGVAVNGDVPPNLTQSLGGVWVANDKELAQLDPDTCGFRCPPQPAPLLSPSQDVTGLAYWEDRAALLMSDSANNLYWIDTSACQFTTTVCDTWRTSVVPAGFTIGGLATDDVHRYLFVAASTFGQSPAQNKIWATSLALVQKPVGPGWCGAPGRCELTVPTCGGSPLEAITGLAFDAGSDTLYITDGQRVVAAKFRFDPILKTCSLTGIGCCVRGAGDRLGGLCVVQRSPEPVGKSCVGAPCASCPTMVAGSYGSAFLGNRNFALTLRNAPTGSTPAFAAIGAGACVLPGVSIGFCGTAKLDFSLPPLLIPMRVTPVGSGPCDGNATLSIGVPPIPALCGAPISVQWAMECRGPNGGAGKAISNCLTFEITTN